MAKKEGYRTRAAYKLLEIHKKDNLFESGISVVDLGSAPGGWSQVAASLLKKSGKIIALDILEMEPIDDVTFICGDFTEKAILHRLEKKLNSVKLDLVISDIAPNMSGVSIIDQGKSFYLAELALDFACQRLREEGKFLVKVFQGSGYQEFLEQMRDCFKEVLVRKPKASRDRSTELYLLGKKLR